jgi:GAF domain-containing protein
VTTTATAATAVSSLPLSTPAEVARRVAFLAGAGRILGSSLDYRLTLQQLAELGLGVLGDVCLVGLVDDAGEPRLVAGAHVDPAKQTFVAALRDLPLTQQSQTAAVLRSGQSHVLADISEDMLQAALDPSAREVIRGLELGPTMVVPMAVPSGTIGVLVFSRRPGRDPYVSADVALAEELAGRAAAAVDNARAFSQTSQVAHP